MNPPIRSRLLAAGFVAALSACGGSGDDPLPQLPSASSGALRGTCADLAGFTFGNTTITAATAVDAGVLTVAGQGMAA